MPCRCPYDEEVDTRNEYMKQARKSLSWLKSHYKKGYDSIVSGFASTEGGKKKEDCDKEAELETSLRRAVKERDMYKRLYRATEEGKKKMKSFEEWLSENGCHEG